jgi:hypothetical protein
VDRVGPEGKRIARRRLSRHILPLSGVSIMPRPIVALILATPFLLLAAGCGTQKTSAPSLDTANTMPAANHQPVLDNVAVCFHEAVTVLQAEPKELEDIAIFMKDAQAAVKKLGRDSREADFDALRWNSDGTSLITASGERIRCRLVEQSHDNFGPQGSEWISEYEFYVPRSNQTSRTSIQLTMRD